MYKKLFIIQSLLIILVIIGFCSWQIYSNFTREESKEIKTNEDVGVFECNPNVTMEYNKTALHRTNSRADELAPPNTRPNKLSFSNAMSNNDIDDSSRSPELSSNPSKQYYLAIACSPLPDGYHYDNWDIFKSTEKGVLREPPEDNLELLSKVFPYQGYDVLYHPDKKTTWELRDKEGYTIGITMRNLDYSLEKTGLKVILN